MAIEFSEGLVVRIHADFVLNICRGVKQFAKIEIGGAGKTYDNST